MPRRLAGLLVLLAGCGGADGARPRAVAPPAPDAAISLAAALPVGADRCSVARPMRISEDQRPLFLRLSATDAFAWVRGLPVEAYASATRYAPDGRRAKVILLRIGGDVARVRERVSEHAPIGLRWDEPPGVCEGERCSAPRAELVDERTVRIDEGDWPARAIAGAERRCFDLAVADPEALEIFADRGESMLVDGAGMIPAEIVTRADRRRIERTKRLRFESAARAREIARLQNELDLGFALSGLVPEVLGSEVEARVEGDAIVARVRVLWEDLELAVDDERRLALIAAREEQRRRPLPPEDVDVGNLRLAREQIELRQGLLSGYTGSARLQAAQQLRLLLVRTLAAHPSDPRLAIALVRLGIDELRDPDSTLAVIDAFVGTDRPEAGDPAPFRMLRREALALRGAAALAPALEADGIVPRGQGARAARALVAMRARGTSYEWAEGAWTAATALERRAGALRLRPVRGPAARLALPTLPETLQTLLDLAGPAGAPNGRSVFLLVRVAGDAEPLHADADLVAVEDARGHTVLLGATPGTEVARLRALGSALAAAIGDQRVDLAFGLLAPHDDPATARVLRLAGRGESGALVLDRADPAAAEIRWAEVERWLADPLLTMEERAFPPPDVWLAARTREEVERILVHAAANEGLQPCEPVEMRIHCVAAPHDSTAARRLVLAVARELLAEDLVRLAPRPPVRP